MTSQKYISQVLEAHLGTFYNQMKEERPEIMFQQDGAPSHTSKLTKRWLADHRISLFLHPPSSPDVNPIESVWHKLKKIIQALPHPPTSVLKLIKAVQDAWDALEIPDIDKYVDTMSERVQAVLDANGGHTRF
jgi:transposase